MEAPKTTPKVATPKTPTPAVKPKVEPKVVKKALTQEEIETKLNKCLRRNAIVFIRELADVIPNGDKLFIQNGKLKFKK